MSIGVCVAECEWVFVFVCQIKRGKWEERRRVFCWGFCLFSLVLLFYFWGYFEGGRERGEWIQSQVFLLLLFIAVSCICLGVIFIICVSCFVYISVWHTICMINIFIIFIWKITRWSFLKRPCQLMAQGGVWITHITTSIIIRPNGPNYHTTMTN